MKDMQKLKSEYEGLVKRLDNIEEVGCFELKKVIDELKDLTSRVSLTYTTLNMNATISNYDKANSADIFRELDEKAKTQLTLAEYVYSARRRLLNYAFAQYMTFKDLKRENQKRIKEYEIDLDQIDAVLKHISDPFAQNKLGEAIAFFRRHVEEANRLNETYDEELEKLERDCRVLLDGGRLSTKEYVDEEEIMDEINRDISTKISNPVVRDSYEVAEEVKETAEELKTVEVDEKEDRKTTFVPFSTFERRLNEGDSLDHEEATKLSEILDGDAKEEVPEREASKEPEKTSETDEVIKPPKRKEEKETKEAPEEEEVAEEAKPVKLDVPPRRTHAEKEDEEVDGKTEETKEADEEDENPVSEIEKEDRVFRAVVKQPKMGLLKRVGKVVGRAIEFLAIITAAISGTIAAKNTSKEPEANTKEEIHEETEAEEKDLNIGIEHSDDQVYKETDVNVPVIGDVQKNDLNAEVEATQNQGNVILSETDDIMRFLEENGARKL